MDTRTPLTPVDSSAIAAIGYEAASRTLFVRFHAGATYAYLQVPHALAQAFEASSSKGRFFGERIDPVFRFVRLEG